MKKTGYLLVLSLFIASFLIISCTNHDNATEAFNAAKQFVIQSDEFEATASSSFCSHAEASVKKGSDDVWEVGGYYLVNLWKQNFTVYCRYDKESVFDREGKWTVTDYSHSRSSSR